MEDRTVSPFWEGPQEPGCEGSPDLGGDWESSPRPSALSAHHRGTSSLPPRFVREACSAPGEPGMWRRQ